MEKKKRIANWILFTIITLIEIVIAIIYFTNILPLLQSKSIAAITLIVLLPIILLMSLVVLILHLVIISINSRLNNKLKEQQLRMNVWDWLKVLLPTLFTIANIVMITMVI